MRKVGINNEGLGKESVRSWSVVCGCHCLRWGGRQEGDKIE